MTSKILVGDVLVVLGTLEDASVDCVVTSPPYWGLRDYQTADWEGGDSECDHRSTQQVRGNTPGTKQATNNQGEGGATWSTCGKCGARRTDSQLGLEPTPEEYVETMVKVFREVARVLKPTGTVWLNLGDSYNGSGKGAWDKTDVQKEVYVPPKGTPVTRVKGLKPKDLCGIPWRVAFGLQDDGWYLRQEIIWHKPNPMPESVKDRCTKSHEYIFLLSKNKKYYYDADAIREDVKANSGKRMRAPKCGDDRVEGTTNQTQKTYEEIKGANKRSVWTVSTKPYKHAHFATFPPELPRTCILAGCPEGGTVLDPFAGAGTTLLVANQLQRHAIGIELNPEYAAMAEDRIYSEAPLLNQVALG